MISLNFRQSNALGLATVKIIGYTTEQILAYAASKDLEFMPSVLVQGFTVIKLDQNGECK